MCGLHSTYVEQQCQSANQAVRKTRTLRRFGILTRQHRHFNDTIFCIYTVAVWCGKSAAYAESLHASTCRFRNPHAL